MKSKTKRLQVTAGPENPLTWFVSFVAFPGLSLASASPSSPLTSTRPPVWNRVILKSSPCFGNHAATRASRDMAEHIFLSREVS